MGGIREANVPIRRQKINYRYDDSWIGPHNLLKKSELDQFTPAVTTPNLS
jgi:hypothetical protein